MLTRRWPNCHGNSVTLHNGLENSRQSWKCGWFMGTAQLGLPVLVVEGLSRCVVRFCLSFTRLPITVGQVAFLLVQIGTRSSQERGERGGRMERGGL